MLTRRDLLAGAGVLAMAPRGEAGEPALIAAASSLRLVMPRLVTAFAAAGGGPVRVVFGSSGNLYRQMLQGAPYEVFLSADEGYVDRLAKERIVVGPGQPYARGRLALFAPRRSPLAVDGRLAGLAEAFASGRVTRFAIANPDHAPYGRAAVEALAARQLWPAMAAITVMGENVSQVAQFALNGADGGLLAGSLVVGGRLAGQGRFALIDEGLHSPLVQRMALANGAGAGARGFFRFMGSSQAGDILRRGGFTPAAGGGG